MSLADAKTTVGSYDSAYHTLVQELVDAKVSWRTADALLDTLIASGATSSEIQAQNLVITDIEMTIAQAQASLKSLKQSYEEAQNVINDSLSIPDPDTIITSPFVGVTGPTGPQGETGGSTGPTGSRGYSVHGSSSAIVGSLAVSTGLYAPLATFSSATFTSLTSTYITVGTLSADSVTVPALSITDLSVDSLNVGTATSVSMTTESLTVTGDCSVENLTSAGSISVSGICTSSEGFVGTLATGAQTGITEVGTLSSLTVSGIATAGSLSVGGCTVDTDGNVSIPSSLTVNGTDFSTAIGGLGFSQSWSSVTASRSIGTAYQNSTTRPILVNVTLSVSGSSGTNIYNVNVGVSTSSFVTCATVSTQVSSTVTTDSVNVSVVVPPSQYYQVSLSSGSLTTTIASWTELK
jgi:hypothetical protein